MRALSEQGPDGPAEAAVSSLAAGSSGKQPGAAGCDRLCLAFLAYGVLLRGVYYFTDRSLWFDEAAIALNIINRSYVELLQPLDHNQAAPPLFLWAEKAVTQVLGPGEYALRLLPFLASLAALGLFYELLRRFTSPWARPIAMGLFAAIGYGIYFAAELKPYTLDSAVSLGLFLILIADRGKTVSAGQKLRLGLVGSVSMWAAYPSVLMLAATEVAHALGTSWKERRRILWNRLPVYALWLLSFAALYFGIIQTTLANDSLVESWGARYPDSLLDIGWLLDAIGRFFYRPLGFKGIPEAIAALSFLLGCIWLYRRRARVFVILMLPLGVTLAAGYLRQYPFRERLILFLVPFALVFIAEGMVWLLQQRWWLPTLLGAGMLGSLLVPPVWIMGSQILTPNSTAFHTYATRSAVEFIQENWQDTDVVYVASRAELAFQYYTQLHNFQPEPGVVYGQQPLPDADRFTSDYVKQELSAAKNSGERVWLLFVRQSEALPSLEAVITEASIYFRSNPVQVFRTENTLACVYPTGRSG